MALSKKYLILLAAVASFGWLDVANATTFEAVGIAPIEAGGIEQARIAAIRDARLQASIQAGAELESSETTTASGATLQSSRIRARSEFANVTVVREWREGDMLHVLIRADDKDIRSQTGATRTYKKKVVAAQFAVNVPQQLNDVDDIWNGFPRELMRRLDSANVILPHLLARPVVTDISQAGSDQTRTLVKQTAEQNDGQFVLSGVILDAGVAYDGGYLGYFKKANRRFEVEVFIHDGLTGALVGHHRVMRTAIGKQEIGRDIPFGSARFYASDYGANIAAVLDELAQMLREDLERLPFAAKIVRVAGSKVFMDAGATSGIGSGDTMVVYQLKDEWQISSLRGNTDMGIPEVPLTTVAITQVQPLFSSGELQGDAKSLKVRVGDLVRFERQK
jgi:hypothetical protein